MQKTKEPRLKPRTSIKSLFREWGLILFILVVIIVASTQRPEFLTPSNLVNILRSYSTYGIAALGVAFTIIGGGMDLSIGSTVSLSAVVTMLIINAIEVSYGSNADYIIDDETTDIKLIARGALERFESDEKKRYAIAGLILAYYEQLKELTEEYYEYLSVEAVERELAE